MWSTDPSCLEEISSAWNTKTKPDAVDNLLARIEACAQQLQHRWIPRPTTFKVIMPKLAHLPNLHVRDLIDFENVCWHVNLVKEYFLPLDAEMILAIPLCASWPNDKLIWHYCPDGSFSVRSAYHMIMKDKRLGGEGTSGPRQSVWKVIWDLCLPPRIKMFAWRICKGILPTNQARPTCAVLEHDLLYLWTP
ncbi:hypothetical protein Cgig2_026867 [Carnegiea gigantea]|uniref:Reverse transcriptase zinc-binding domain-containing protein n=1 Tax=Carnegiea gigantea TaxID=171969 RepID=A0A9Q1KWZ5_9CARY|nr:hypothetical protein Cgig2_026867 [Carnegiea gigantea]